MGPSSCQYKYNAKTETSDGAQKVRRHKTAHLQLRKARRGHGVLRKSCQISTAQAMLLLLQIPAHAMLRLQLLQLAKRLLGAVGPPAAQRTAHRSIGPPARRCRCISAEGPTTAQHPALLHLHLLLLLLLGNCGLCLRLGQKLL